MEVDNGDATKKERLAFKPLDLKRLLKTYYQSIFPFKPFCAWMSYGKKSSEYFGRREFAFILEEDVHLRYRSFATPSEFESELCSISPHKLDLGAVYSLPPKEGRGRSDFVAVKRELVFDIDLTDYKDVRTCCEGAKVCRKCWKFIALAVRILDARLRKDMGFSSLFWVFSGRRGVHCWVGDQKARALSGHARSALAEYLSLLTSSQDKGDILDLRPKIAKGHGGKKRGGYTRSLHPMLEGAYRTVMETEGGQVIEDMVVEQGWLRTEQSLMKGCRDEQLRERLQKIFTLEDERLRWQAFLRMCDERVWQREREAGQTVPRDMPLERERTLARWFVLFHVYPRLDVNVSTGMNHLLKSPFCVHPGTGCVAVPIDPDTVFEFDVESAPRIDLLIEEVAKMEKTEETKENRKMLAYRHSSLAPHIQLLEKFTSIACATA